MTRVARQRIVACLAAHDEIVVAYLFGSSARGNGSPLSDVDIAVLWGEAPANPLRARAVLTEQLARAADKPVDVILLDDASPALAARVLRESEVLLCRDDDVRVRFEIDAMRRDLDTAYLRRSYDRTFARSIREGRFYG